VVEAEVGVELHRLDSLLGVRGHDPALGDLLDRQFVGGAFHLGGAVDGVLLLGGEGQGRPEPGVLECPVGVGVEGQLDLDHPLDRLLAAAGLSRGLRDRGDELIGIQLPTLAGCADEAVTVRGRHIAPSWVRRRRCRRASGSSGRSKIRAPLGVVVVAIEADLVLGPQAAHQGDGLAEPGEALLELRPGSTEPTAISLSASPLPTPRKMRPGARQARVANSWATTAGL
jgi:hypothetical protein